MLRTFFAYALVIAGIGYFALVSGASNVSKHYLQTHTQIERSVDQ